MEQTKKITLELCEMIDEPVYTKHKVFRFPNPLPIAKVELEIPSSQLEILTDFFYKANGKFQVSKHQIGVTIKK